MRTSAKVPQRVVPDEGLNSRGQSDLAGREPKPRRDASRRAVKGSPRFGLNQMCKTRLPTPICESIGG